MSRFCLTVHRWGVLYLYIGKIYIDPVDRRQLAKGWRHSRQHCSPPAWRRIMDIATRILSGSPWWVYGLLALLIWLGLQPQGHELSASAASSLHLRSSSA